MHGTQNNPVLLALGVVFEVGTKSVLLVVVQNRIQGDLAELQTTSLGNFRWGETLKNLFIDDIHREKYIK